jgi:hypothetical protein
MASDENSFEIPPVPKLEDLTTPAVTTSLKTRLRYERTKDDKNASLPPSKRIPQTQLKTAIAPQVLAVICRHYDKVNGANLTDEALLTFLQGYAKTSLKGTDYDLTFFGAAIEYQMNLKPFDRLGNLTIQCEKINQTYGLQQMFGTKAGKNKWREVIIFKIKPKPFSGRLGRTLTNSLDRKIRDNYAKFFDWLKERNVFNARKHKRDSSFQSHTRASVSSKQTKGFNNKGQKCLNPQPSTSSFEKKKGDKTFKADKGDGPRCFK